jgi:hypothetical protein
MQAAVSISEEARTALESLPAHGTFARAPRLRAVLQFLIRELLEGRADDITELRIAETVFHRGSDFNAAEDTIVRVTVGNLRARLEEYYQGEGSHESWVLEIPKGKYNPSLRRRAVDLPIVPMPVPAPRVVDASVRTEPGRHWIAFLLIASLAIVGSLLAYRYRTPDPEMRGGFIAALFAGRTTPVTVVVPDMSLQNYRYVSGKTVPLGSYLSRSYIPPLPKGASQTESRYWPLLEQPGLTATESVAAAVTLQAALSPYGVTIRNPSEMGTPSFENEGVILIGGPYVNPWVQLFENRLNFRTLVDADTAYSEIQNVKPVGNEPSKYVARSEGGVMVSYLRIAVLPNLSGSGQVVLIGGTRGASQAAGCNYLTQPGSLNEILKRFGAARLSQLPPFELLIELHAFSRTSLKLEVVASRRLAGAPLHK